MVAIWGNIPERHHRKSGAPTALLRRGRRSCMPNNRVSGRSSRLDPVLREKVLDFRGLHADHRHALPDHDTVGLSNPETLASLPDVHRHDPAWKVAIRGAHGFLADRAEIDGDYSAFTGAHGRQSCRAVPADMHLVQSYEELQQVETRHNAPFVLNGHDLGARVARECGTNAVTREGRVDVLSREVRHTMQ